MDNLKKWGNPKFMWAVKSDPTSPEAVAAAKKADQFISADFVENPPTVISVSGGKTSAYLAANYPADRYVFSLVRTSDQNCKFPDRRLAAEVEDRIGADFVGTLEDDRIIHTIMDLEQFIGRRIDWVTGETFDQVIENAGGYLPNVTKRFCTQLLKVKPIFFWTLENFAGPVNMSVGYRANEGGRAEKMIKECNNSGLTCFNFGLGEIYEKGVHKGKRRIIPIPFRRPDFPLLYDAIYKDDINEFWRSRPVRFSSHNNCCGCFHRSAAFLKLVSQNLEMANKFDWFLNKESKTGNFWKSSVSYEKIKTTNFTGRLFGDDGDGCSSGYCGY